MCDVTKKPQKTKDHMWLNDCLCYCYFIYIWNQPIATYFDKY